MTITTTSRLFNPATYDAEELDPASARLMRATIDWFESEGQGAPDRGGPLRRLVRGLHRVPRARAGVRDAAHAGARRRRRPRQALGHRPQRDLQRDPRLLRASVLVRVAGHDPRPRTDLAERQRGGSFASRRAARGRRDLRLRPLRARPRRRHLLDRHGPHPRRRGWLQRERRQVLHRQRQPGRHGVGLRAASRRRRPRWLCLLRRRQLAPGLRPDLERGARADVRQRLRAE